MTKKTRTLSVTSVAMIVCILLCTAADAIFNNNGAFTAMKLFAMIAAVCGVVNCALSSDGSIWNWLFGLPAVVFQGIVALHDGNIGVGYMDLFFLVPMQVIGFAIWARRGASLSKDADVSQVKGRTLSWPMRILLVIVVGIALACLSPILSHFHSNSPWFDAAAVVMQIVAQILMSLAFMEQWVVWIIVNATYVMLWVSTLVHGGENAMLMIAMWLCYFVMSVHGLRVWMKISK